MFKHYSEYAGGTCCPLVISSPKGIKSKGEVRNQYHHSTDIVLTIVEVCGLKMPTVYRGVKQYPLSGVSIRYSFTAKPDAATKKKRQYYAVLGTRGMWEKGWNVAALHAALSSKGHFDKDEWELYHVDKDRSESTNLAQKYPARVKALVKAWFEEAKKNSCCHSTTAVRRRSSVSSAPAKRSRASSTSTTRDLAGSGGVAVNVRGRSYKILADVKIADPDCSGVIFAQGSRFGGHTLFLKDKKLHYVYNFLGIKPEQKFSSDELKPSKYTFGMEFIRDKAGEHGESLGKTNLYVNDKIVAQGDMKSQSGKFTLSGDGALHRARQRSAVSEEYKTPGTFKGGAIQFLGVTVEKAQYLDLEKLAHAAVVVD
jgi:arylsulfatase